MAGIDSATFNHRYEILAELGEGGFGTVYKARQLATGQLVAIKVLRLPEQAGSSATEKRIARFEREMRLCAQMHHPNIVRLIDSGRADGQIVYTVFEFVPGDNLADVLAMEGRLDPQEAKHLLCQALDALACAHAQGVVHRDLKPANMMVIPTGARRNLLVLDFGIGALIEGTADAGRITATNEAMGTPAYAAPEQLRGFPPTPRSDLYAWGLVLLECLTGVRAVTGASIGDVIFRQLGPTPIPIHPVLAGHRIGTLLRRATEKDPAARDVTAEELLRALEPLDLAPLRGALQKPHGSGDAGDARLVQNERAATTVLVESEEAPASLVTGELRQITAVCCATTARGPGGGPLGVEEADDLYRAQQALFAELARPFDGQVVNVFGDLVLIVFGLPHAREDDARRAARAALAVAAETSSRGAVSAAEGRGTVGVQIGVHTGMIVRRRASVRSGGDLDGPIVGTTPKTAAALCASAAPGSIVVSDETRRLLRGHFVLEERGPGAGAFTLLRESGEEHAAAPHDPMVGRDQELAALRDRWRLTKEGAGQAVLVSGEPGIGKSRLVRELARSIASEPHLWLECRCSPDAQSSALFPVAGLLGRWMDDGSAPPSSPRGALLESFLARQGFDAGEVMPLFAPLFGLPPDERYPAKALTPQKQKELTLHAILSLFGEASEKAPLVLVVEDLQWADATTLELLGQLVGDVASTKICFVMTARPELSAPWSGHGVSNIQLRRLGPAAVEAMTGRLAGDRRVSSTLLEQIVARADGVPLFVEEILRSMIESGAFEEQKPAAPSPEAIFELTTPATLRELLTARLDRLGDAKETAQVASAIGREVELDVLVEVSRPDAPIQEHLDALVAAELLFRKRRLKGTEYTFKHALVRDAAYESMLKKPRQDIHARIAAVLLARDPAVAETRPDLLEYHFVGAGALREAAHYALLTGRLSAQRSADKEAERHLTDGLRWVRSLEPTPQNRRLELDLRAALGPVLMGTRGFTAPELEECLEGTAPLVVELGDSPDLFPVRWIRWAARYNRARYLDALKLSEENLEVARRHGKNELLVAAHQAHGGGGMFMLGRTAEALEHLDAGLALYDVEAFRPYVAMFGLDQGVVSLMRRATILCAMGRLTAAEESARAAMDLAVRVKHAHTRCLALALTMEYSQTLEDRDRIRATFAELKPLCTEHGIPFWDVFGGMLGAWASAGTDPSGVELIKAISGGLYAFGARLFHSYWRYLVADGLLTLGRPAEAVEHVREALAFVEETEERWFEPDLLRVQGRIEAALGQDDAAEASYRASIAKARDQRTSLRELRAATALAELLVSKGRAAEARAALAPPCEAMAAEPDAALQALAAGRALLATLP